MRSFRLLPSLREKVWGTTRLGPWFPDTDAPVGEVWFTFDENLTDLGPSLAELMRTHGEDLMGAGRGGGPFPILTKFLFTAERLSIQVHPEDEYARAHHNSPGKTEMWFVLRAEPGASIAVGFKEQFAPAVVRAAALDGAIEELVRWVPVAAGDTIFCPAGTVHAIGAGLAVCEIQQNSDITYRLYDYGRPRELHLDESMAVADLGPHPGVTPPLSAAPGRQLLALCDYFATELVEVRAPVEYAPEAARMHILMVIQGTGTLDGKELEAGQTWIVPASAPGFRVEPAGTLSFLRTFVP
ncbi:MAG TPA: type I phosphomannose isomerase catalytic subunit [Bryobacteraceae bacterium]|nr:type I phosphomannose isomerase catalytic subunit [Bryobacteraceae bacterium]